MASPDDLYAQAFALGRAGRFAEALETVDRLLATGTPSAAAHALKGAVQARLGDFDGALGSAQAALALDPSNPEAHAARGDALMRLGRPAEALGSYQAARACAPGLAYVHTGCARALLDLRRPDAALQAADEALRLQPRHQEAWTCRGQALLARDQPEPALAAFRAALDADGRYYEAFLGAAAALRDLGRHAEAIALLDEAERIRPDEPRGVYRRALIRLLTGDFAQGWRDYHARWRIPGLVSMTGSFAAPVAGKLAGPPAPEDFAGRRVAVLSDQGIGDAIMFLSALPDLLEIAAQVTCVCDRRLAALLSASFPDVLFFDTRDPPPAGKRRHDLVVASGDLGAAFRRTRADFPGAAYLRPRQAVADAWAKRLGPPDGRLRVGLSWRGGSATTGEARRSIPLPQMIAGLAADDIAFVSLQYGDVAADLQALDPPARAALRVFPAEEIDDFEPLAGLIANLDVVVSVQTTVVHLSGALGKDCLAMIPARPEWRYGAAGETMPWYRSVRLFRQDAAAWEPVLARIAGDLATRRATPPLRA